MWTNCDRVMKAGSGSYFTRSLWVGDTRGILSVDATSDFHYEFFVLFDGHIPFCCTLSTISFM